MTTPSASLPLSGMSALVVEPEAADRAFLVSTLTSAGFRVTDVDGFDAARPLLLRRPPAVLITEIQLGLHNGLHLAYLARWRRLQIHLVVMSRYRDPVLMRDAHVLGAAFVQKPFTPDTLLATIGEVSV